MTFFIYFCIVTIFLVSMLTVPQILMSVSSPLSVALTLFALTHLGLIPVHVKWGTHQLNQTRNPARPTSVLVFWLDDFQLLDDPSGSSKFNCRSQESYTKLSGLLLHVRVSCIWQMLMSVSMMLPSVVLMPTAQIQSALTAAPASPGISWTTQAR